MENEAPLQKVIQTFLDKNILLSSEVLPLVAEFSEEKTAVVLEKLSEKTKSDDFVVLNRHLLEGLNSGFGQEKPDYLGKSEKKEEKQDKNLTDLESQKESKVKVLFSYSEKSIKREVSHFISYFRQRYRALEQMLSHRKELKNRLSLSRIKSKREKEPVSAIGMVTSIQYTKNNNIMITIEDLTSSISVVISKNRADDLYATGKTIVLDEVIGIEGLLSNGIIFANSIVTPDIPITKELKKSPKEEYVAFLGDPHIGSSHFLKTEFSRLISWLNGKVGDEKQKDIASKIKYLVIVGDIVDGVGVYPSQEEDLEIPDIYAQYEEFTKSVKQIPPHIQIIISPGNHDAMRMSEPQPPIYQEFSKELHALPNITSVSNPALVNIGQTEGFPGFDILIYHGFSFPYYADTVEPIRAKGGLEKAELIMEFLLKKRHLAPSHTSTLYIPDAAKDPLIIEKIPDFFVTGHIHRTSAKNYNNITLLNCSCWIGQTPYQEKVGLKPQPARLPVVNLKTREIKILKFGKEHY